MLKLAIAFSAVLLVQGAYDDLPKVSDPYNAPGYEPAPKTCPDSYVKLIEQTRAELGANAPISTYVTNLSGRVQTAFGMAHEVVIAGGSRVQHKTNFNGTVCNQDTDYGFHYTLYPTPATYNINDPALEDFFTRFSTFAAARNPNIADLPSDPRH